MENNIYKVTLRVPNFENISEIFVIGKDETLDTVNNIAMDIIWEMLEEKIKINYDIEKIEEE